MNHRVVRGCWLRLDFSSAMVLVSILVLVVFLAPIASGGVVDECANFNLWVRTEFGVQLDAASSHTTGRGSSFSSGGNPHDPPNSDNLCVATSSYSAGNNTSPLRNYTGSDCCSSSIVDPFLNGSTALLSAFNNSEQFNRFKSKISMYETVVMSHESGNAELWNDTIEGLRVLKRWGVNYWDPVYLYRNKVFSNECAKRVAMYSVCGGCRGDGLPPVKPCKSLCHNVVAGCIKSPLAEFIESPWKHAVNSVRTAIRVVITTGGDAKQNTQPLLDLVSDLNEWREPITWWISEYKRASSCDRLPTSGCWNGDTVGKYEFGAVTWKSTFNPEFSNEYRGDTGLIAPNVIVELDRFRNELVYVRKSLEKYWPTTTTQTQAQSSKPPPHALALSSSESISSPHRTYIHDLVSSGDDGFETDDEDLDDSSSGFGHLPESDDEDLNGYGSGSGSSHDEPGPNSIGKVTDSSEPESSTPPVSLSSCSTLTCCRYVSLVFSALVLLYSCLLR